MGNQTALVKHVTYDAQLHKQLTENGAKLLIVKLNAEENAEVITDVISKKCTRQLPFPSVRQSVLSDNVMPQQNDYSADIENSLSLFLSLIDSCVWQFPGKESGGGIMQDTIVVFRL